VSPIRRLAFWVLLFAMPFQALAAPGWLCANAVHHSKPTYHLHDQAFPVAHDLETTVGVSANHSHEVAVQSDQAGTAPSTSELPGVGKCSACSGCCSLVLAVLAIPASSTPAQGAHEVAAYVNPAIDVRAGDGPFRPPRTLTL